MTQFRYTALDASGESTTGTVDAMSLQAARELIAAKGLEPMEIYEESKSEESAWEDPVSSPVDEVPEVQAKSTATSGEATYVPLLETLRLYAGWLLAWYCLVYAIGSYQFTRELPMRVPYAESLFLSPLVLSFTFAAYIFLIFSGIYKYAGRRKTFGFVLLGAGIVVFLLYRMNVQ
jgi:hypothetical protein